MSFQRGIRKELAIQDAIPIKEVITVVAEQQIVAAHALNIVVVLVAVGNVVARAGLDMIVSLAPSRMFRSSCRAISISLLWSPPLSPVTVILLSFR